MIGLLKEMRMLIATLTFFGFMFLAELLLALI